MNLDTLESIFLIVVFSLFGVQTLAAGVGWWFGHWRDFQDMRDATLYEDDDEVAEPSRLPVKTRAAKK